MRRGVAAAWLALTVVTLCASPAVARPLDELQPPAYYWGHGAIAAMGYAGSWAASVAGKGPGSRYDLPPWVLDDAVRPHFRESAAALSDRLLWVTVALPLGTQMSNGFDTAFGNAALVYTQTLSLNALAVSVTKTLVRRPRPYTHATAPRIVEFVRHQGAEAYRSFYSGHASLGFGAAMAGSILYAARTEEPWARHVLWGLEFGLAGMVARLRVAAGRHYRSDIWAGMLIGAGIGLLVPTLHEVELDRIRWSEWTVAAGATTATLALAELFDLCGVVPCSALPHDVRVPVAQGHPRGAAPVQWAVLPAVFAGGAGVQGVGIF